jgi:hypothetical protein
MAALLHQHGFVADLLSPMWVTSVKTFRTSLCGDCTVTPLCGNDLNVGSSLDLFVDLTYSDRHAPQAADGGSTRRRHKLLEREAVGIGPQQDHVAILEPSAGGGNIGVPSKARDGRLVHALFGVVEEFERRHRCNISPSRLPQSSSLLAPSNATFSKKLSTHSSSFNREASSQLLSSKDETAAELPTREVLDMSQLKKELERASGRFAGNAQQVCFST